MIPEDRSSFLRNLLPPRLRLQIKTILVKNGCWNNSALTGKGVINDLYYWVSDENLDTLLPLQNYFSVFFPDLETETSGTISLYDPKGRRLGARSIQIGAHQLVKLRVSDLLRELRVRVPEGYGTLLCDLRIPEAVLNFLDPDEPFYFWDRFYLGYLSKGNQPCFVHGVDKTTISHVGRTRMGLFYPAGRGTTWYPEIPVTLGLYKRFSVILTNRTNRPAPLTLTVSDSRDASRSWSNVIHPFGVHRFELDAENTRGLDPEEMRLRVDGIPSRWGRPVVFKEFHSGAISAMHC